MKVTVNGDRGTLHFECHYVDVDTGKIEAITAGDLDVARIDGAWLITNMVGKHGGAEDSERCRREPAAAARQEPAPRSAGC